MATAKEIIDYAISQIGIKETPSGSNKVKYNTWYYSKEVSGSAYPWCAVFCCYVFNKCNASKLFYGGKKSAYCPTIENYYKSIGRYYGKTNGKAGDLCLMDFGKGRASHIGIVESKNADGSYNVIEGNTSVSNNANGGCVMRRVRRTNVIRGFARPDYESSSKTTVSTSTTTSSNTYIKTQFIKDVQSAIGTTPDGLVGSKTLGSLITVSKSKNNKHKVVKPLQKYLNALGFNCGTADGVFGNNTHKAIISFQTKYKLSADGIVGKNTWKKLFDI